MDIPAAIRVPLSIEQGSVFNFLFEVHGKGRVSKNRYFVVLNRDPKTDTVLLLLTSTSHIAKQKDFVRRAQISESTIVTVLPSEYSVFTVDSAFNCNNVYQVKISDLVRKIDETGSMNYPKLSKNVISRLVAGVMSSPRVAQALKRLI